MSNLFSRNFASRLFTCTICLLKRAIMLKEVFVFILVARFTFATPCENTEHCSCDGDSKGSMTLSCTGNGFHIEMTLKSEVATIFAIISSSSGEKGAFDLLPNYSYYNKHFHAMFFYVIFYGSAPHHLSYVTAKLPHISGVSFVGSLGGKIYENFFDEPSSPITELSMTGNELQHLPDNIFDNLINLHTIFLDDNNFAELSPNLFEKNVNLSDVSFQNSNIKAIPDKFFTNAHSLNIRIDFSNNKIHHLNR